MAKTFYKLETEGLFKYWAFEDSVGDLYKMEFNETTFVKCGAKPSPETEGEVQGIAEEINETQFMEECGTKCAEYFARVGGHPPRP